MVKVFRFNQYDCKAKTMKIIEYRHIFSKKYFFHFSFFSYKRVRETSNWDFFLQTILVHWH